MEENTQTVALSNYPIYIYLIHNVSQSQPVYTVLRSRNKLVEGSRVFGRLDPMLLIEIWP